MMHAVRTKERFSMQEWVTPAVLEQVAQICRDAGAIIMPYFEADGMAFDNKDDARKSQVTEADTAAEAMILPLLRALAPHVPIVAEEEMSTGHVPDISGGEFWLVDPLDGTKEFIKKIPEFTVNIGLIRDGKPVLGVVYSPASNHLYAGSTLLDTAYWIKGDAAPEPLRVRKIDPDAITICLSRTYGQSVDLTRFLERFTVEKQVDAGSSIKFCMVARGEADVYPRYGGSMEWDTAAAHAVLNAAGGRVCEINDGPDLAYGKTQFRNPYFVAWGGTEMTESERRAASAA
jgi:3'(2'), 5'-bisphosphate nucleotidase